MLVAALLLMLTTVASCNRATAPGFADVPTQIPATTLPAAATPAGLSPATNTPIPAASSADGVATNDEAHQSPRSTVTWPVQSTQLPCGVLLPLLSPGQPPLVQELNADVTDISAPDAALPALERLLNFPGTVGLAAYEIGRETEGVYLNADTPMPLASVVKIINLIAYAQAAADGDLDPAEWVKLDEMGKFYLPRSDLGAHNRALADLEQRRLIALDPPATPLEEIPQMMIRHSSNAAADYLHMRLGQQVIEKTIIDLGLASHTAPCPWIGQFLTMANRHTAGDSPQAIQSYIDDPERYGRDVMRLAESFIIDETFRAIESEPGWRAPLNTQTLFSENLNAQASARDYAGLMSRILQNGLSSDYANILVRRTMEWPMVYPVNQELFTTIGLKDGSLPGILTTAYYAQRIEDGASVVVTLFYRQLPRQTYRQWRQDLPHDELARWLLSDPEAIAELRLALQSNS